MAWPDGKKPGSQNSIPCHPSAWELSGTLQMSEAGEHSSKLWKEWSSLLGFGLDYLVDGVFFLSDMQLLLADVLPLYGF